MEGHLDLPHPIGVGVLLPQVTTFNLAVLPHKVKPLAEALEVETLGLSRAETIAACAESIRALYADIGFPEHFTPAQLPPGRVREMAELAVPGLYAGIAAQGFDRATAGDDTLIACPSARKMTVRQAEQMFEACLG
jgi:alcohol dehydrogenase class IV